MLQYAASQGSQSDHPSPQLSHVAFLSLTLIGNVSLPPRAFQVFATQPSLYITGPGFCDAPTSSLSTNGTYKCTASEKAALDNDVERDRVRLTFQHKMGELKEKVESLSQMMETTLARNRKLEHELERLRAIAEEKLALEALVQERTAAANEAQKREELALQDKNRVAHQLELQEMSHRKNLDEARGHGMALESQVHAMQISIARTEGSNVELSQSLTDAKHETKRALEDTSHIRTQHLIDTTLTHSADRIGAQVTAAAVDTAYRAVSPIGYRPGYGPPLGAPPLVSSRPGWHQADFSHRFPHLARNVL